MTRQAPPLGVINATRALFTRLITSLANSLADEDLTVPQVAALHLVFQSGTMNLAALGEALRLSPSATTRMVDGLVRRGWMSRVEDPSDRRARVLSLTSEGSAFIQRTSEERAHIILETMSARAPRLVVAGVMKAMDRAYGEKGGRK